MLPADLAEIAQFCRESGVRIIAFGCKEGVGKDTAGGILVAAGYKRLFFAEPVYRCAGAVQAARGEPVRKCGPLLQLIGGGLKQIYGEYVWVRDLAAELRAAIAAGGRHFVITDLRHRSEYAFVTAAGATTCRITRASRALTRDPAHPSETELDGAAFNHDITNDGTMAEFVEKIETLFC